MLFTLGLFSSFSVQAVEGKRNQSRGEVYLQSGISKQKVMEGERVIYEVRLVTNNPDIAGIELVKAPVFGSLPYSHVAGDTSFREFIEDGKVFYSLVIDRYFIGAEEKGKYSVGGGTYRIGLKRPERVNDPFWGPSIVNRMEVVELEAPVRELKVASLPKNSRPELFSGAIGEFSISVFPPEKDILAGEENIIVIAISGKGDLTNAPAPDVKGGFREGLHFRSMTDDREHFITKGELGSEMKLECVFTADKPGKYVILPIKFCYYDSNRDKYVILETDPIEIEVKESKAIRSAPPVYHQI
ncbi:MAG: hypothetical protein K2H46_03205 [Muribaculaceae bacterium]|nr:hypothetical protein [Muribaculaceae bacterium]